MSIDKIIDLRHTPALTDTENAHKIIDAASDIVAEVYDRDGTQPDVFLLTTHQHNLLSDYASLREHFDRPQGEPALAESACDQLFGIPVEVIQDIYPYLIGGPLHGHRTPKVPVDGGPIRVPAPATFRRKRPDPCGGYIDYGYRELEYRQMRTSFGPGEYLSFYTCCENEGTALSLLTREMRRAVARESRR